MKKTTITDISEPRYLIVTADDLCMTEGITNGIIEYFSIKSSYSGGFAKFKKS